jgi:hypothetical protein
MPFGRPSPDFISIHIFDIDVLSKDLVFSSILIILLNLFPIIVKSLIDHNSSRRKWSFTCNGWMSAPTFMESNKGLYLLSDMIEISQYHFLAIMLSLSFANWKMKGSHPLPKGEKSKHNLAILLYFPHPHTL